MCAEVESMWTELSDLAVSAGDMLVAERCAVVVGQVKNANKEGQGVNNQVIGNQVEMKQLKGGNEELMRCYCKSPRLCPLLEYSRPPFGDDNSCSSHSASKLKHRHPMGSMA